MDFSLSEEQQLLKDTLEKFVTDDYNFESRRKCLASPLGYSAEHWSTFASLGWLGMGFREEDGGYGGSAVDLMVIMQAFGKGLVIEPFLATVVMAGSLVADIGNQEQKQQLLHPLMEGNLQLALAYAEQGSRYSLENIASRAMSVDQGYKINASKIVVLNGPAADHFIVSAKVNNEQGISLFVVAANAPGVKRIGYTTVDGFQASELLLDDVIVGTNTLLGDLHQGLPALQKTIDRSRIASCAEALGAMEALLWKTVDYTKTRKQFSVSLSSFQALQHRMADMFIESQLALSLLYMAAMTFDTYADVDGPKCTQAVIGAKARIAQAGKLVAQEAVQLHGGMGVSDELDVGHYLKRLTVIDSLFGNRDYLLAQYARQMS